MQSLNPFGLRPAFNQSGAIRTGAALATIESAYATNIFQGAPVVIATTGYMTAVAAGDDTLWNGAFSGVEYTDVEGRRRYSNRWIANTVATDIIAYYTADAPGLIYEIQADDTLDIAAIGEQFPFATISGNTTTGLCTSGLDVSGAVGAGDQSQLRVVGLNPGPDNAWGDAYPVVLAQNAAHPWVARVNVQV
jgi:hypothetical protein